MMLKTILVLILVTLTCIGISSAQIPQWASGFQAVTGFVPAPNLVDVSPSDATTWYSVRAQGQAAITAQYDLGSSQAVKYVTLRLVQNPLPQYSAYWEYSANGTSWTLAAVGVYSAITLNPPVTARYWRVSARAYPGIPNGFVTAAISDYRLYDPDGNQIGGSGQTSSTPPAYDVVAAPTGSNKVTLYWTKFVMGIGYNIYRGLSDSDPGVKINQSPVTTPDPGPGAINRFVYTDNNLTQGTEYFYRVVPVVDANGTEASVSSKDSATPDPTAVPWDTADATQIVSKWKQKLGLTGGTFAISGPNGVRYLQLSGETPHAEAATARFNSGSQKIEFADNTSMPVTLDFAASSGFTGYGRTNPPSGIYLKAEAKPGVGLYFSGLATLPDPSTQTQFLRQDISTLDTAYIYSGGTVGDVFVDAGLQCGTSSNPGWKPYFLQKGPNVKKEEMFANMGQYGEMQANGSIRVNFYPPGTAPNSGILQKGEMILWIQPFGGSLIAGGTITPFGIYSLYVKKWRKESKVTLKRVNSIAQEPLAIIDRNKGFQASGARIWGAAWGTADEQSVTISGTVWDYSLTLNYGSFPGNPFITSLLHNQYFWEENITLKTTVP